VAHFGAGCFWSPSDALSRTPGVKSVTVGYAGDDNLTKTPSYDFICSGRTKLVETVRVEYDPDALPYETLLNEFDKVKKVDVRNKRQYSGVIFVPDEDCRSVAVEWLKEKEEKGDKDAGVVTVEDMSDNFWVAEKYHQNYWGKWRPRFALGIALLPLQSYNVVPNETVNDLATAVYVLGILYALAERRFANEVIKI